MANVEYLKNKDCAQLLYQFYKVYINWQVRYEAIKIPTDVPETYFRKYKDCCRYITKEEIWAYHNEVIFISDEPFINRLEVIREGEILKRTFLLMTALPAYQMHHCSMQKVYNSDLDRFSQENGFFEGVCDALEPWLRENEGKIQKKEAEKIIENIGKFIQ